MFNLKHIAINLGGALLPMLLIFFTVPLYLGSIGAEKYGILAIVWLVFGYFGILDFGISRVVTMQISQAGANKSRKLEIIQGAAILNVVLGICIAILGAVMLSAGAHFMNSAVLKEVSKSIPMLMIGIPLLMLTASIGGALDGEERFKLANGLQFVASSLYQIVPLATSYWFSKDIATLINSIIVARIFVFFIFAVVTAGSYQYFDRSNITISMLRRMLKDGSGVALVNLLDPIFTRVDQLVVAKLVGPNAVAAYSIAVNSIGRLGILPLAMSRSIFPKLAAGDISINIRLLINSNVKVIILWTLICLPIIFVSDFIFSIWLRNSISFEVSSIAKVFIVGLWANGLGFLPYTALQACGKSMAIVRVHLIEMPFYLAALVILTWSYGAVGTALAYTLRCVVDYLVLWKICGVEVFAHRLFFGVLVVLVASSYALTR